MFFGLSRVSLESDLSAGMPQDMPIYQLNDRVSDKFGSQDTILLVLRYNKSGNYENIPADIRNPDIVQFLVDLENSFITESSIDSVVSFGTLFKGIPVTQTSIDLILEKNPEFESLFSDDKMATFVVITADVGGSDKKINDLIQLVQDRLSSVKIPPGLIISSTGTPLMQTTLTSLLGSDAIYTFSLAFILIFFLLVILEKSFIKPTLIFIPLSIGFLWTLGTLGWIGLKISIATAGLGAMILGLGVEYGIFMLNRFREEYPSKSLEKSILISVPAGGKAILGSGFTTTFGFLALTISIMPMLQDLGKSLALGILFALIGTILIAPVVYFEQVKLSRWIKGRSVKK